MERTSPLNIHSNVIGIRSIDCQYRFTSVLEGCRQRFNDRAHLLGYQQCHVYSSTIFYTRAQAFNRTTLVLRQDLPDEGIGDFDFVTSPDSVSKVTKIINSEIVNNASIIFTIAITVNFVKLDMDGAISTKVS